VLVVEDNFLARDALVALLNGWGLEVTAVHDAPGALQALRATAFDAVLSDWRLPGADDGLAVLRQARALQPGLKLAAMITGEDTHRMAEAPLDFPVLRKPVRPLRLRALLERYVREHKAA
jgi:CheY-like chemotaxis protein